MGSAVLRSGLGYPSSEDLSKATDQRQPIRLHVYGLTGGLRRINKSTINENWWHDLFASGRPYDDPCYTSCGAALHHCPMHGK
ncbi:hypothetical protein HaLaN_12925, partial [Haematococcus lacustris]